MHNQTRFTEAELERMRDYEQRTGRQIVYTFEEKCTIYRNHPKDSLENAARGITNSVVGRMNLDNQDSFDSPDDEWKLKVLQDNLEAIRFVLREKS